MATYTTTPHQRVGIHMPRWIVGLVLAAVLAGAGYLIWQRWPAAETTPSISAAQQQAEINRLLGLAEEARMVQMADYFEMEVARLTALAETARLGAWEPYFEAEVAGLMALADAARIGDWGPYFEAEVAGLVELGRLAQFGDWVPYFEMEIDRLAALAE